MKSLLGLFLMVPLCVACAQDRLSVPEAQDLTTAGAPDSRLGRLEAEVHQGVNQHRARQGLPALAFDARVAAIARAHSEAMAQGRRPFSHEGFDERTEALQAFMPVSGVAENIFFDTRPDSAGRAVAGWLGSSGHRGNIEGPYTVTGVGVSQVPGGPVYYTQIFVSAPAAAVR